MTRKQILSAWVVILAAFMLALLLIITSIMWLPAFLIDPDLVKPISQFLTKRIMQEMSKMMFRGMKTPTQASKTVLCGEISTGQCS